MKKNIKKIRYKKEVGNQKEGIKGDIMTLRNFCCVLIYNSTKVPHSNKLRNIIFTKKMSIINQLI